MPGRLLTLTPALAAGWACHPRLTEYRVLVHVLHRSVVVRSAIAGALLAPEPGGTTRLRCGFRIDLTPLGLAEADLARLRFNIGETDEWIEWPDGQVPDSRGRLTVEDLLVDAHRPRPWVSGMTYLDAQAGGLRVETIIDMLYRDYLGRPSDPHGLAHYAACVRDGSIGYDDIRRSFIEADEYRLRRKYVDHAPGSIFSQRIVMAAAAADAGQGTAPPTAGQTVVAAELARLDGSAFIAELYRRILLKEPDEGGMAHYLYQLQLGVTKMTIIRTIAGELEAITAGVRVTGYLPEDEGEDEGEDERADVAMP